MTLSEDIFGLYAQQRIAVSQAMCIHKLTHWYQITFQMSTTIYIPLDVHEGSYCIVALLVLFSSPI